MNLLETRGPHTFGPWTLTQIVEWEGEARPYSELFPNIPIEVVRQASPTGAAGRIASNGMLIMSTQFFLLQRPGIALLVELGTGNRKKRPAEPYWDNQDLPYLATLGSLGVKPEDIGFVFLTHLHSDHVGLATFFRDGRWTPTFSKARHLIHKKEFEFWNSIPPEDSRRPPCMDDSVVPLVEAGLVDWVKPGDSIAGLKLHDAAGHSPGALLVEIEGERVYFIGDLFHHPAEIARPDWPSGPFDWDQEMNTRCRTRWLSTFAETNALLFGVHTGNGFRVVTTAGGGFFPKRERP
jgi:glyoxylase-like metal-dependent hydrolase (beta-lactamase superfamily II)